MGGSAVDQQTIVEGGKVTRPADPKRQGFAFDGWYLEEDYTPESRFDFDNTIVEKSFDLYAKWKSTDQGCYVATSVYGSYDCPEVWTLRRFRDEVLAESWYGRLFIRAYYATSPTLVKLFGDTDWFQNFWKGKLDTMVADLQNQGFKSTPYQDRSW